MTNLGPACPKCQEDMTPLPMGNLHCPDCGVTFVYKLVGYVQRDDAIADTP